MEKIRVRARVNSEPVDFLCEPGQSLLECLRDVLGLTGTKEGCNDGNCGSCSVLLDDRLVNSCLVLGAEIDGREVLTVEGLASAESLHPIQRAFIQEDALQCGYCTPGFLLAVKALLDVDPNPSEEKIRAWLAGNLCRCTGYDRIVRAVQAAASDAAGPLARGPAAPYRVIGSSPERVDATDKVTGRAVFGADVRLPGLLHGRILRSPHAHARILSIDTRRAENLQGVKAVVTAADLPRAEDMVTRLGETYENYRYICDNNLAATKVLYVGHAVAAVAATTRAIAEQALELVDVRYQVLPPVTDVLAAVSSDAPLLHEGLRTQSLAGPSEKPSNVARHVRFLKGDPEAGFRQADVVVEHDFRAAMVHQGYIEPQAATAAWSGGVLTVYASSQGAFDLRDQIATLLELPKGKVTVVPTEVGGAFGGKIRSAIEVPAALLSRASGRPVRVVMSRSEVLTATGPTPGAAMHVRVGARRDGKLTAVQAELYYEAGAYPGAMIDSGAHTMFAGYEIPSGRVDAYDVVVNRPKAAAYRAPCSTVSNFAVEQLLDELAEKLDMDPIELRLANAAREGTRALNGTVLTEIGCTQVLEAARRHPHYTAPLGGPHRGRGVAHGFWGNWGAQSSCVINVNADGTVSIVTGSVDLTGTRTSLAMQAAEALEIDLGMVRARFGDTESTGYASVSAGSRTTVATGHAVVAAARDVIALMKRRAAVLWRVPEERVTYDGGVFSGDGDKRLSFAQLAAQLSKTGGPLSAVGNVDVREWGSACATHIADVEVDPETGAVRLLRYTAVQDVGRAIHPTMVEGQMQGGAAQGIGWALFEGYRFGEDGRMLNPNLLDYKLPTALDVPPIETVLVEVPYSKHPYGARGAGEVPIVPPPAAIANAIKRAIGSRVRNLPMSPGEVLRATGVIEA